MERRCSKGTEFLNNHKNRNIFQEYTERSENSSVWP